MQLTGVLVLALVLYSTSAIALPQSMHVPDTVPKKEADPTPTPIIRENKPHSATIEYGSSEVIKNNDGPLFTYIRYPQGGNPTDSVIYDWAHQFYNDRVIEFELHREEEPGALGEINIQFDSYLVDNRYAGVYESGEYNYSLAMPVEIITETFNIDLSTGRFLENSDILDFSQIESIIAPLLRNRFIAEHPSTYTYLNFIDETWLGKTVIARKGIMVIIEKDTLLLNFDTLTVTLPYDELGSALLLDINTFPAPNPAPNPNQTNTGGTDDGTESHFIDSVDQSKPIIALTFDDGPGTYTNDFLDLFEEYGIRATFCVVGNLVNTQPDTLARAVELGSEVIGHSWDHKNLAKLNPDDVRKQLVDTMDAIEAATGTRVLMFRPPYGESNESMKDVAAELDMALISWSVDAYDWDTKDVDAIYNAVLHNVENGAIILSHETYKSTLEAYKRLIPDLLDLGYQIVTVSELFFIKYGTPEPGRVYYYVA